MTSEELEALFAEPLEDGSMRGHLNLIAFVAQEPSGATIQLWPSGPRAEIYAARRTSIEECQTPSHRWRLLLNIERRAWERWKKNSKTRGVP